MTKAELIKALSAFEDDADVVVEVTSSLCDAEDLIVDTVIEGGGGAAGPSYIVLRGARRLEPTVSRFRFARGYNVMTYGGGRYTACGWYPTLAEANAEVVRLNALGSWSGMPPRVESSKGTDG